MAAAFASMFEDQCVSVKIGGQEFKFRPCTVGTLLQFGSLATSLWQSLDVILRSMERGQGFEEEKVIGTEGTVEKVRRPPIDKGTLQFQMDYRKRAIEELGKAFLADSTREAVGAVILDSLRGQTSLLKDAGCNIDNPTLFVNGLPVPALKEMLVGVGKANMGSFGPLAERVATATKAASASLLHKVESVAPAAAPSPIPSPPPNSDSGSSPES